MSEAYEKLLQMKKNNRTDYFIMALSYYFDIGHDRASRITFEDIKNAEGNGFMTKDFCQWLIEAARQIAESVESAVDVVQFCMAEDIFETKMFAGKLGRDDLEEMLANRISYEKFTPEEDPEYFEERYGCDIENFAFLGCKVPEESEVA